MAGIRTDFPGFEEAVPIDQHKAEESNLERKQNAAADAHRRKGPQKFPMHVHKAAGLYREVQNEDDLADALRKGWKADIREVDVPEPEGVDTSLIFNMPIGKALKHVKAAPIEELAKIEADELAHGARAKVMAAIAEAKDNAKPTKAAAKSETAAAPKKKTAPKKK